MLSMDFSISTFKPFLTFILEFLLFTPCIYRLLSPLLFPSLQASCILFSMLPLWEIAAIAAVGGKRLGRTVNSQVILVSLNDEASASIQEAAFSALGLCWPVVC